MAGETALSFSKEELEYFREMSRQKYEFDMQRMRARAKQEGRAEGHAEGREEGREEGLEAGREEGRAEEKRETARKLKTLGLPVAQIAEVSGLPPEEIDKL